MSTPTLAARTGLSRSALNARPQGLRTIHHTSAVAASRNTRQK
jgi:hypothetical protein